MSCYTSAERSEETADDALDIEYYKNLAIWMREQEMKREEQEEDSYYESYEPVIKEHKILSRGTRAQRTRKVKKMNNFAQAVLTGTIDQTKKNIKKYKKSIIGQAFTDALPQDAKTLAARREHRKREINHARLSKIDANTAGPSPSEQREMKDIEIEENNQFWESIQMEQIRQSHEMQALQYRRRYPYTYECEYDSEEIDRHENMCVGDMLAREHQANVNDCYYDCSYDYY